MNLLYLDEMDLNNIVFYRRLESLKKKIFDKGPDAGAFSRFPGQSVLGSFPFCWPRGSYYLLKSLKPVAFMARLHRGNDILLTTNELYSVNKQTFDKSSLIILYRRYFA